MSELKELIARAKQKNVKAMEELFNQFKPLLKSRAKRYSRMGLEYEDIFQYRKYLKQQIEIASGLKPKEM
jgi:DNA-directed RNA polymerase specialized sigma subunit